MEFFVQTACNNKLTVNISDWVQKKTKLKLSVELILYDLLTDLHLKQAKLALVRPDPYQQLIEGQSFHYTAHSGRKGTRIVKYYPVMEKCETSLRSKIILQTSAQSGNAWPQTTQIDTAPDR